jgi:endo-1,4-beta-D-glucanase Y
MSNTQQNDPTEDIRREQVNQINTDPGSKEALEAKYGKVWDTSEMQQEFEAISFLAPYIVVRRKSDGVKGTLTFQHNPRYYFNFQPA